MQMTFEIFWGLTYALFVLLLLTSQVSGTECVKESALWWGTFPEDSQNSQIWCWVHKYVDKLSSLKIVLWSLLLKSSINRLVYYFLQSCPCEMKGDLLFYFGGICLLISLPWKSPAHPLQTTRRDIFLKSLFSNQKIYMF